MLGISWQVTLLALVLLPVFVLPARRMGRRLAALRAGGRRPERHDEHPDDRAVLRARRDPGQAVRPAEAASRPSSPRGPARVRDIGVRTAMVQWVFITALTLVSALALALVYGLGGYFALHGQLDAGAVVALALLLTRLYAPLTALASARVEVMTALVSFERVFEVLDLQAADRGEARRPAGARRAGVGGVRRRALRLPVRGQGVARVAGGGRHAGHPRRRGGAARRVVPGRARPDGRAGRLVRRGQVHDRVAGAPALRRRLRRGPAGRRGRPRPDLRLDPRRRSAWSPRTATCSTSRSRANLLLARPGGDRRRPVGRAAPGPAGRPGQARCPTGWTPWSASAATGCPAASGSG